MSLRFILGTSGSGKTTYSLDLIAQDQRANFNNTAILIVPDQFSFQAEKDAITAMGNKAIMRVKVLSFNRLAYTVFSKTGCAKATALTEVAKAMALKKIILDNRESLVYYKKTADKQGFIEQLTQIITEFFRYTLTPAKLLQEAQNVEDNEILTLKLRDLTLIYNAYVDFINQGYLCDEETLDLLYHAIGNYKPIEDADIWIDGFNGFTPQEFNVIKRLLKMAKTVNVVLTMDKYALKANTLPITHLFFETKETYNTLCSIAVEVGAKKDKDVLLLESPRFKTAGLLTLEKNFAKPFVKEEENFDGIEVLVAPNPFDEVEAVALKIIELTRDKNYRYRDIAILAGNLESYETVLKKVMTECKIPFFMDNKQNILGHPLVALVKGVMEVFIFNFSFDSVFNLLKTYLTPLARDEVEVLENYCLAHGIKGYKWNLENWSFGLSERSAEEYLMINALKNKVIEILLPLAEFKNIKKAYKAEDITKNLFIILQNIAVTEKLEVLSKKEEDAGIFSGTSENRQCWGMIVDILDSLTNILGSNLVTLKEYYALFDSGLAVSRLGIIPPTIDNVAIGTLERTRLPEIKALFVVGANDGVIPSAGGVEGIIKDDEREYFQSKGFALANGGARSAFEEQFLIYCAITKPKERLFFSFASGDLEGKSMIASPVINKVMKMFPNLKIQSYQNIGKGFFSSPAIAFHHLSTGIMGEESGVWTSALKYFEQKAEWAERTALIKKGITQGEPDKNLTTENCKKLFASDIFSSVSRLERFASCPYSYFMAYTMKAKERALYQLKAPDLGLLFHGVLEDFSYNLKKNNLDWKELSKEEIICFAEEAVDRQVPNIGSQILLSTNGLTYLVKRLKRISVRAISTLAAHLRSGEFIPFAFEVGFGNGQQLPPIAIDLADGDKLILTGKIDRVDILQADGTTYVKIIDYKSGKKAFSLQDVYYGLQMQLLIYLDAIMKSGKTLLGDNILPGGVFYFRIADPILSAESRLSVEEIENLIEKQLSMTGLVLKDDKIIHAMDKNIGRYSSVIPAGYKTSGEYTSASMVASKDTYEHICSYTVSSAAKIAEQIKKGIIHPSPYKKKGYSPCSYCIYGDVCGFDESEKWFKKRNLKPMSNEDVFEKVEEAKNM